MPYVIYTGTSTAASATSFTGNTVFYNYAPPLKYLHQNTHPVGAKVRIVRAGHGWDGTEGFVVDPDGGAHGLVHVKATKVPGNNYGHVGYVLRFYPKNVLVVPTFLSWARKHK